MKLRAVVYPVFVDYVFITTSDRYFLEFRAVFERILGNIPDIPPEMHFCQTRAAEKRMFAYILKRLGKLYPLEGATVSKCTFV